MEFKKFDRVLMREEKDCLWGVYIFYNRRADGYYYAKDVRDKEGNLIPFKECIPFEGNERFIGITDDAWMPKMGDIVLVRDYEDESWLVVVFKEYDPNEEFPYRTFNQYTEYGEYDTDGWRFCKPLVKPVKEN